jgi:predicted DNA-binding transcriptional regulator AlpA
MQNTARTLDNYTIENIVRSVVLALKSEECQDQEFADEDVNCPDYEPDRVDMSILDGYPPILNAKQVKQILGVSESFAYEVMNSSSCPTIRMGKRMVVPKDSFLRFLKGSEGKKIF